MGDRAWARFGCQGIGKFAFMFRVRVLRTFTDYVCVCSFCDCDSSLIEVMPVGYTDYNFNILAESCKIWYYELQSLIHPSKLRTFLFPRRVRDFAPF